MVNFYNRDKKKVKLNFINDNEFLITGNELRLSQVFSNIIDNALSFNNSYKKVEINIKSKKNNVSIEISDNGSGIPKNNLDKIFERFFTERLKKEEFGQHSGLGLSIVKQIIDAHSGEIKVENCIDSIKEQTTSHHEIIVVDNASPDSSGRETAVKYPDCKFILNVKKI